MSTTFPCNNPLCREPLSLAPNSAAKRLKCPRCGTPNSAPTGENSPPASQRRLGPYRLVRKVNEGGMGSIYEAIEDGLGRRVALKVISKRLAADARYLERFRREARAAAKLSHPNVVQVFEVGEEGGYHFFAMEFIEGESLRARLQRGTRIPTRPALRTVAQVAKGLEYAHKRGIVHRDIKPDNIMLTVDGHAKVADLGLAKNLNEETITATGAVVGSPAYMSPEQADDASRVDCRSDIYSLGITLFHMVTGQRPFEGTSAVSVLLAHEEDPLPDPRTLNPEIPDPVCQLIEWMCAKSPDRRPQTPSELSAAVEEVLADRPPRPAGQRGPAEQAERGSRRARAKANRRGRAKTKPRTRAGAATEGGAESEQEQEQEHTPAGRGPGRPVFAILGFSVLLLLSAALYLATRPGRPVPAGHGQAAAELWLGYETLVQKGAFSHATRLLEDSKATLGDETSKRLGGDTTVLVALWERSRGNLPQLAGREVRIGGKVMEVVRVEGRTLHVKHGEVEMEWDVEQLDRETVLSLGLSSDPQAAAREKALIAFHYGSRLDATRRMKDASAAGVDVSVYTARLSPVLVVETVPPGAQVEIRRQTGPEAWESSETGPLSTPFEREVGKNASYRLRFAKESYQTETRVMKVGEFGEYRLEVSLKEGGP